MEETDLDALLLTTEPEVRYFSGFHTAFWLSPTRPWFLVVPREGKPIAVIPEIGRARMADTWLDEIITWPAPRPSDEGITELSKTLNGLTKRSGIIGLPMGTETHIRMPFSDFNKLRENIVNIDIVDATNLIQELRAIKSHPENSKIRYI
jgi:Xaa-Pro aminopeptidase